MGSTHPYYRRTKPEPQDFGKFHSDRSHIDLTYAHMDPYGVADPVAEANRRFDRRAAAAIATDVWGSMTMVASVLEPDPADALLERKVPGEGNPDVHIPRARCLGIMAFVDYFPKQDFANMRDFWSGELIGSLRDLVSKVILAANAGWCGTFGPGTDAATDLAYEIKEGNYDMSQMHLLQLAYRYYDELSPAAREHLITELLAKGRIHRPGLDVTFTSGATPNDWSRAGLVIPLGRKLRIGETENHNLTILTARYLTNQLLYQRNHDHSFDNRRNGDVTGGPNCTDLILSLLRNILRDDFSEYNAKNYQSETRTALLNLHSYSYDHEVRLAARMVLDYISARVAVSSNDLRRMMPFRRRNEGKNVTPLKIFPFGATPDTVSFTLQPYFMDVGLLEASLGADPLVQNFAMQAGNTRAFATTSDVRHWPWGIKADGYDGNSATFEALSDYRLPPSIHALFVDDLQRRFFQRLHRTRRSDEVEGGRNCDNYEIYAGSPSYLISAGGQPATYAVDPGWALSLPAIGGLVAEKSRQQLGVAVTTSFMPTGLGAGLGTQNRARDLIQFSTFSEEPDSVHNYGVAPDFACGELVHLPGWTVDVTLMEAVRRLEELGQLSKIRPLSVRALRDQGHVSPEGTVRGLLYMMREIVADNLPLNREFLFVNRGSSLPGKADPPGFYLAIYGENGLAVMEAFDTWLHPELSFDEFKQSVRDRNPELSLRINSETQYTTQNGSKIQFILWNTTRYDRLPFVQRGAKITKIVYGTDAVDGEGDAGNVTDKFLAGTVMNAPSEAVVEITNRFVPGARITLDFSDPKRPKRISESGEIDEAGSNHEVWVDFDWKATGGVTSEGDFFRPFTTIADAVAAVADTGVVKVMPGLTRTERAFVHNAKRVRITAPLGGVTFGAH
jgi:hypothetical protein